VEISDDDTRVDAMGLEKMYAHKAEVEDYDVFWGKHSTPAKSSAPR
jgi:hypothetical protein